ncbi:MAG: hypothetical protein ACKVJG_09740 [Candidatus Latescibacterota bacterium]|jgi:hypothetical protein
MEQWVKCISILALCCIFFLVACGGDDDKAPTGPKEDMGAQLSPEAVALTGVLVQSFQSALFASLVADTDTTANCRRRGHAADQGQYVGDGGLFS